MSSVTSTLRAILIALLALPNAAQAQLFPIQQVPVVGSGPANQLVVSGASAASATNWPMQFGRPFLDGAIPHSPQVLINGTPVISQADVKNRYPDGSVEYAVIAVQIPQISPSDCTVTAASPGEASPYTLWPAHGNSPVFTHGDNTTGDPLWGSMDAPNCHKFDGNISRSFMVDQYVRNWDSNGGPGSGAGFTENPPFPAQDVIGAMYMSSLYNYGANQVKMTIDPEGGGGNSSVIVTPNTDAIITSTYDGVANQECIYGPNVAASVGAPDLCAPFPKEPTNTFGNLNIGADGDHIPSDEGPITFFDQAGFTSILTTAQINTLGAARVAYYATPGSASPVECSLTAVPCAFALSVTHRMVAGATTAFQLYNLSAATFQDIGFDGIGNVNTAAALTFCGTVANCVYMKVYDQTAQGLPGPSTLTFVDNASPNNTPMTLAAMEALLPSGAAKMTLTPGGSADASTMLAAGFCHPWTQGPVAQTMICADDTAARTYDLGTGDGFHPFRPRFYVTFWPATSQVFVRAVGENGLSTEQEDIKYALSISDGYTKDLTGTTPIGSPTAYPEIHWVNSRWSHTFWLGGAPIQSVNIDEGLPYLTSTRFLPNLDTSVTESPTELTSNYNSFLSQAHDIYDGAWDGGLWTNAMGTAGASSHIGPFPQVTSLWLHTADWRQRVYALTETDIAGAWPLNSRESDPTRRFQRSDTVGSGTGLGRTISAAGRPQLYGGSDALTNVGAISTTHPWTADAAHQPSMYFAPYILTGDPWYLDMLYAWAGQTVFIDAPYSPYDCEKQTTNCSDFRGPTGAYGGLFGSNAARDVAWTLRGRAETAFAAPDGTPEKSYFTYMTNDAIAKWEGGLGINGTPFDTATIKTWVEGTDFPYAWTNNGGPAAGTIPPLGNMASICTPNGGAPLCNYSAASQTAWGLLAGADGSFDNPWMNYYLDYAVGRTVELGFQAKDIQAEVDQLPIGIATSAQPWMLNAYAIGPEKLGGGFWPTWSAYLAGGADPTYVANQQNGGFAGGMSNGYSWLVAPGLAMAVDQGVTNASTAWAWYNTNGYLLPSAVSYRNTDPHWAIVPRTDTNVLPAQPTTTPP